MKCLKKPILEFQHYNRSIKVPFVIYADFEAFTKKVNSIGGKNDARPWTEKYQKHQPCGFCYKIVGKENQKSVLYRAKGNEDIGEEFMKSIEKDVKKILKKFDFNKKMDPLTKKEQKDFDKAKICWICQKELLGEKKLGIIVIFQENFVEQRIINVIFNIEFLLLLQYFFIICRGMTLICL